MAHRYFTVVLETFDGQQYGMLPLSIEAETKELAEIDAVNQAEDDGWEKVKVLFTMDQK